jgi:hypothetical protein
MGNDDSILSPAAYTVLQRADIAVTFLYLKPFTTLYVSYDEAPIWVIGLLF